MVGTITLIKYFLNCSYFFLLELVLVLYMNYINSVLSNNWGQLFTVDSICNIEETGDIHQKKTAKKELTSTNYANLLNNMINM